MAPHPDSQQYLLDVASPSLLGETLSSLGFGEDTTQGQFSFHPTGRPFEVLPSTGTANLTDFHRLVAAAAP